MADADDRLDGVTKSLEEKLQQVGEATARDDLWVKVLIASQLNEIRKSLAKLAEK